MIRIAHLADIHIRNAERHDEYKIIFKNIILKLRELKPDYIIIAGDLFENYIEISNEAKIISGELLNALANICTVILIKGNHDIRKKNINRIDSIQAVVRLIKNPNVIYYSKTGHYPDAKTSNLNWVVYDHVDKITNPWDGVDKDPNKIYIGLYHDPVLNSTNDDGKVFNEKHRRSIEYFDLNDYLFLGDIHKRQFCRANRTAAYSGSVIQQDHGEKVEHHGFLLWDIEDSTKFQVKAYDFKNEHTFINFHLDGKIDYDNLNLTATNVGSNPEIAIHWKDYSSNMNTVNEQKIRDYIRNKYNTTKIKFDKIFIYTDIISSKMISETLDMSDSKIIRSIFQEYLEEQKYSSDDIEEILKIDDIITNRMNIVSYKTNIEWEIEKFWFSNFRSYGDDNEIPWKDVDGIIQIHGENQQGKSTILDAITYILYGTILTAQKEKFGDKRYINNKRILDSCLAGAVINANGEKFVIQRKTTIERNKLGVITASPTVLDFYNDEVISDDNILNEEQRNQTQTKLNSILGDFKDFVRLSFTNADNLNELLSTDRSVFIDSIIRDAGYDVFEKKLKELSEYKKEIKEEKLTVNLQDIQDNIRSLHDEVDANDILLQEKNDYVLEYEKILSKKNKNRDQLNKRLHRIDESLINFNASDYTETIKNYETKINDSKIQIAIFDKEISSLPSKFELNKLNILKTQLKEANDNIMSKKEEILKVRNSAIELDSKKDKFIDKINELKDREIQKNKDAITEKEISISRIKNEKEKILNTKLNDILEQLRSADINKNDISNQMKLLQKDGAVLKNENEDIDKKILELKNTDSCPLCKRPYDKNSPHQDHNEQIKLLLSKQEENKLKLNSLISDYNKLKIKLQELEVNGNRLSSMKDDFKNEVYSDDLLVQINNLGDTKLLQSEIIKLKSAIDNVKNEIYSDTLQTEINRGLDAIKTVEKNKENTIQVIKNIENEIKNLNIESIEDDISIEEKIKENYDLRKHKSSLKENLLLNIDKFDLMIKESQGMLDKYKEIQAQIEENIKTEIDIALIDSEILLEIEKSKNIGTEIIDIEKANILKQKDIDLLSIKLEKYLKQKRKNELFKEYQNCISRDGIPTFLLRKSIHIINRELNSLLSNVDFTLHFDENLLLKLSPDIRLDISQNAIESSGKERTFCALALKMALRQINVKSKLNFIVLDEITGKLIEGNVHNSIQEFTDFLDVMKTKLKKIIIIEHINPINFDGIIEVNKDEQTLVSSLVCNF